MARIDFSNATIKPSSPSVYNSSHWGLYNDKIIAEYIDGTYNVGTGNLGNNHGYVNVTSDGFSIFYNGKVPATAIGSSQGGKLCITSYYTSSRNLYWIIDGINYEAGDTFCFQVNFKTNI